MSDIVFVVLEGRPIGEIERLRSGELRLRFDERYRSHPGATPLSVSMPVSPTGHGDARVGPWLWGLLPDNADVLSRWGRDFGVSITSPFPVLSTPIGLDCAGAVQFCPPGRLDALVDRPGEVSWLTEADIATRLRTLRSDSTSWLGPGFAGQFSLGGAQAKTALYLDGQRWGMPSGATPTTHILKPAIPGLEAQHLNEHVCLTAARALGLPAAATRIEAFEDESAIVVERFDRTTRDGSLVRVHQEDLCQALSVHPARKYQADGGPTPGRIADLLRTSIAAPAAETDLWRFADALIFNWLIAGTDAHAKNYGLMLSGSQVRLAPLYDVSSFLPYDDSHGHRVKLAMKVGGDYRLQRTDRRAAWERAAGELGLDARRLIERVIELARGAPSAFEAAASDSGLAAVGSDLPRRLVDLVDERCRLCADVMS